MNAKRKRHSEAGKATMEAASCGLQAYSRSIDETSHVDSCRNLSIAPGWKYADTAVLKEYTDLGGKEIPEGNRTPKRD